MLTQEEIVGKVSLLQQAKCSKDVKIWIETIEQLMEQMSVQYMNEKGEEAVRAWGVMKGLHMATNLDMIYSASVQSKIVKPQGIIKP